MDNANINITDVLSSLKEQIGNQAQEIAILKATIAAMSKDNDEVE